MKSITIAGGVTRDATLRQAGEAEVLGFSVAVNGYENKAKTVEYFDCSLWGNRGAKLAQYITKGSQVAVTGELGRREHDGKTYLTIRANEVTLLGGGERKPDREQEFRNEAKKTFGDDLDDSIPF